MLKKNTKVTSSKIKFKSITKILRSVPNGYSTTRHLESQNEISVILPCFSSRSNHYQLIPNKFISSIQKSKEELNDDFIRGNDLLLNNTMPNKANHFKTESQIYPITITDECESIQNICLTEQSESVRNIYFTEQCDYHTDTNNNNISLLDTSTKLNQRDTLNQSDLMYNINVLNLEKATMKLTEIIEKKNKRRLSYNKTNIDLATNKLSRIIDKKKKMRRTCSGRTQIKLNKYIEIFKEEKKFKKIKKLEDIINKERKSGVPTSTPSPCPSFKEQIIKNRYFIHNDNDNSVDHEEGIKQMSYNYMIAFKSWKICKEKYLLNQNITDHLASLVIQEEISISMNVDDHYPSSNIMQRNTPTRNETGKSNISQWARKDISNELAKAEIYKDNLNLNMRNDTVKYDLTALLNVLTVDNFSLIKSDILSIIFDSLVNQEKFIEVILRKAIMETAFVELYAKLCKDLDLILVSSTTSLLSNSKSTLRITLIEACKNIFNLDLNTYTNSQDSYNKEQSIKHYIVGNVNFIGELINVKMITKKVGLYCIESLFNKYNQLNQSREIRLIQIEALVSFINKFGTIIYHRLTSSLSIHHSNGNIKYKGNNDKEIEQLIHNYINQLSKIYQEDKTLPGYIKYKIINLEEKQKNDWKETLFEKTIRAKSKRDFVVLPIEQEQVDDKEIHSKPYDNKKEDDLQSLINIKIKNNLKEWMILLTEGKKPKHFNWTEIDNIIISKSSSIKNIFIAYIESVIDTVINDTTLLQANEFFKTIMQYYSRSFKTWEINELKSIALNLLSNIVEMQLDNQYILQIWGCIIYYFLEYKVFFMKDFNLFLSLHKENIKGIFIAFKYTIFYTKAKEKRHMNDFKQVRLIKENQKLFDEVI